MLRTNLSPLHPPPPFSAPDTGVAVSGSREGAKVLAEIYTHPSPVPAVTKPHAFLSICGKGCCGE